MTDSAPEILDEFVAERFSSAKKLAAECSGAIANLKQLSLEAKIPRNDYLQIAGLISVTRQLAYGLDEAMQALDFYSDPATWTEVPSKTYAASDLGMKARVAKARINPI